MALIKDTTSAEWIDCNTSPEIVFFATLTKPLDIGERRSVGVGSSVFVKRISGLFPKTITSGRRSIETATSELDATLGARWKAVLSSLGREERWVELDAPERAPRTPDAPAGAGGAAPGVAPAATAVPSRPREPR
jgi:hypothetical protein